MKGLLSTGPTPSSFLDMLLNFKMQLAYFVKESNTFLSKKEKYNVQHYIVSIIDTFSDV